MAKNVTIKYTDKDFSNLRGQLVEYAKNYFPDTYNDFSPTSPGMMFIEMAAYVGDVLSFYQDSQLQETLLQYAQDPGNLYSLAYMMGYKPKVTTASSVEVQFSQRVAATGSDFTPNWDQALTLNSNAVVAAGDIDFIVDTKVDFGFSSSYDPTDVTIYSINNNQPAEYLLTKKATAKSGTVATQIEAIGASSKFLTIDINDTDIIGILDITDGDGNKWSEVPFLGQDTVYVESVNTGENKNKVPYLLSLQNAPNRFVSRFTSTGKLQVQFGAGMSSVDDENFLPNPTNVGSGTNTGIRRADHAYDPSNFLFTESYGNAPSNTTLTIRYLKGGGIVSNVEANTIVGLKNVTSTAVSTAYQNTLAVNNNESATGGRDGDTLEELRENSLRSFTEQGRVVTKQDYAFRAMILPSTLGSIAKSFVTTHDTVKTADYSDSNPLGVCMYVLSYDNNKKLAKSSVELKTNLKTYLSQFMMLTDSITIKDAFIINLEVKFDIITLPSFNSRDVLLKCTNELKDYFNIDKWSVNQPINLSSIYTLLDKVTGVQTVQNIKLKTKLGENYSEFDYDIEGATKNNTVYPSLDPMIFEVKYPNSDIKGRVTTL